MSECANTTRKFMYKIFFLIGILSAFLSISACSSQDGMGDSPTNSATSTISADPPSGNAPLVVHFDGSGSSDSTGSIGSYAWVFGDGTTGSGAVVDHTYTTAGAYTVVLAVTGSDGRISASQTTIKIFSATGHWEESDPRISYSGPTDNWCLHNISNYASGGAWAGGTGSGAAVQLSFTGTGIKWITFMDQFSGQARVTLDGVSTNVDLYRAYGSPDFGWQQVAWQASGLANTIHTLQIDVLGTQNPDSGGAQVGVDAFDITQ
jgi:PKD repeat protein